LRIRSEEEGASCDRPFLVKPSYEFRYCLTMIGPLQTGSELGLAVAPPMFIETFV
jgi:hypothetical protein